MRYYKHISGDYIDYVGIGAGGVEISEREYEGILDAIPSDIPPDGYRYKLNTDLTPELYKIPEAAEDDEIRDSEALEIIIGRRIT